MSRFKNPQHTNVTQQQATPSRSHSAPSRSPLSQQILTLQRSVGNAATAQFLRANLVIQRSEELKKKLNETYNLSEEQASKLSTDLPPKEYTEPQLQSLADAILVHNRTPEEFLHLLDVTKDFEITCQLAALKDRTVPDLEKIVTATLGAGRSATEAVFVCTNCTDVKSEDLEKILALPQELTQEQLVTLSLDLCAPGHITGEKASSLAKQLLTKLTPEQTVDLIHATRALATAVALEEVMSAPSFVQAADTAIKSGWPCKDFGAFLGHTLAKGTPVAELQSLLGTDFTKDLYSMITATWKTQELSSFIGAALLSKMAPADLQALVQSAGFPASSKTMLDNSWGADEFGIFAAAAKASGLAADKTQELIKTGGIPAASNELKKAITPTQVGQFLAVVQLAGIDPGKIKTVLTTGSITTSIGTVLNGGWDADKFGEFMGHSVATGVPLNTLDTFLAIPAFPAPAKLMVAAGWSSAELGSFLGQAMQALMAPADVVTLIGVGGWDAASRQMLTDGWSATDLGTFVASAKAGGVTPTNIAGLVNTGGFSASSKAFLTQGFSALEFGRFSASALAKCNAAQLQTYLVVGNAATTCAGLKTKWTIADLGDTVGFCLTAGGGPTPAELDSLLSNCNTYATAAKWRAADVQRAVTAATIGSPTWGDVLAHAPTFATNHVGSRGPGHGYAGTIHATTPYPGTLHGGGYNMRLMLGSDRVIHAENGHTYERFLFTYANCTRADYSSLYPLGTNMQASMTPLTTNAQVQRIAEQAAWDASTMKNGNVAGNKVGCKHYGVTHNPLTHIDTYDAYISQYYPLAGIRIHKTALVALARLLGNAI